MARAPFEIQQFPDGQIYIHDLHGNPRLHAKIGNDRYATIQVGYGDVIEIDKEYGPLVMMPIRARVDTVTAEWVIERVDGQNNWKEFTRIPGQLESDFVFELDSDITKE